MATRNRSARSLDVDTRAALRLGAAGWVCIRPEDLDKWIIINPTDAEFCTVVWDSPWSRPRPDIEEL